MTLRSERIKSNDSVLIVVGDWNTTIETCVKSKDEAETMIAQFQDVMEDFFRVWPELREENENGLI